MLDRKRSHTNLSYLAAHAIEQLDKLERESSLRLRRVRKQVLHRRLDARRNAGWSRNDKWLPAARELRVKNQKRQATEVIAVKMSQQHHSDVAWLNTATLHCDERRSTAGQQDPCTATSDENAGLEAPATAKSISTT